MRQTPRSVSNAKTLGPEIRKYDPLLQLHFSPAEGVYYISRKARTGVDHDARRTLAEEGKSVYSEAAANNELVVCYPIGVKIMENLELARRSIMKHLKVNDMTVLPGTKDQKVRAAEQQMDDEENLPRQAKSAQILNNTEAYFREWFRDHVQTKVHFSLG